MSSPFLSVLSYSGGVQSACMLWKVLLGEIERPLRFLVLNADPGMEHPGTYRYNTKMRQECDKQNIDFITASGPNLYYDLLNLKSTGNLRIDNPPYYTKGPDGKPGRLKQGCTQHYKIAPMRRALRSYMSQKHGVVALRPGMVEMWIGFTSCEWHRCSDSDVAYIKHRYPLVELKMDKAMTAGWYLSHDITPPPRSVCNACFANGLDYFKELFNTEPEAWQRAVDVDNSLEHWHKMGRIREEVFVSKSLIRLRDLPALNFGGDREDLSELHCNSGVCFI